jgi:hypothetical protein
MSEKGADLIGPRPRQLHRPGERRSIDEFALLFGKALQGRLELGRIDAVGPHHRPR